MKLLKKDIAKDGSVRPLLHTGLTRNEIEAEARRPSRAAVHLQGYVKLRPEDDEDMWHIYNLVQIVSLPGDQLT